MHDIAGLHDLSGPMQKIVQERRAPFPHFVTSRPFDQAVADAAHAWLDASAPWRCHVSGFFEQFECSLAHVELPRLLQGSLLSPAVLRRLRRQMEALFGVSLADVFSVMAHRLVPGQGIGVHTDAPFDGSESHRLVAHLGPAFSDSTGGHLIFFNSKDPGDIACAFRSVHNTAVGFELSERSHHAVSDVVAGVRYTIVYSFWPAACADRARAPAVRIEGDRLVPMDRASRSPAARLAPHAAGGGTLDGLLRVLVEAGAARTAYPGSVLLPHLVGTYELLRDWRCSDALCLAGLFHGVYGAASFPHPIISLDQRDRVRDAIGERAERLVHAYCAASRETLERALAHGDPGLVEDRRRGVPLGVDRQALAALATLRLAHGLDEHARLAFADDEWKREQGFFALARPYLDAAVARSLCRVYGDGGG